MKYKYRIIDETEKTITFVYKGAECCFAKSYYSSIDEVIGEIEANEKREREAEKRIAAQRVKMTPEERAAQDEADRAVFERWQDEANTNAILAGVEIDGEDPDFNPFRKNND